MQTTDQDFPGTSKPVYKLRIDFRNEIETKKSSESLTLGLTDDEGVIVLVKLNKEVPIGSRLF